MQLQLLGPVELRDVAGAVNLGGPKIGCLLAVLAMEPGKPVPIPTLIDHTWGEDPPDRGTLHRYISRLRWALTRVDGGNRDSIRAESGQYVLDVVPDTVDLHRFRSLAREASTAAAAGHDVRTVELCRSALGLWHGGALGGLTGDWADSVRHGMGRERLNTLVACMEAELRLGRHAECLSELIRVAAENRGEEALSRCLMIALYRCGQHGEALRHYEVIRRYLAEQFGAEPGSALQSLFQRILRHDGDLRYTPQRHHPEPTTDDGPVGDTVGQADPTRRIKHRHGSSDGAAEDRTTGSDDRPAPADRRSSYRQNTLFGPTVINGDVIGGDQVNHYGVR